MPSFNCHVYLFKHTFHDSPPGWLGLPVLAVGKQWRGDAQLSLSRSPSVGPAETTHQLLQMFAVGKAESMRSHRNPQPL